MSVYRVRFVTRAEVMVLIEADDDNEAADAAWDSAQEFLATDFSGSHLTGRVTLAADLDGIGAEDVEEVD